MFVILNSIISRRVFCQLFFSICLLFGVAWTTSAQTTFTVTKTADTDDGVCDSDCSLREAIIAANNSPGQDTVAFNIGSGARTIKPLSMLPSISETLIIDGTTQPGFAGSPIIEIDGESAGANVNGLRLSTDHCTVKGLVINRFATGYGIEVGGSGHHLIIGNFIGTDLSGMIAQGNFTGLGISTGDNVIGGTTPAERNVISGNSSNSGVGMSGVFAVNNVVQGNYVGTDVTGTIAIGNNFGFYVISNAHDNTIGGSQPGAGNLISGNFGAGVGLVSSNNKVQGNRIGTTVDGIGALSNSYDGVDINEGHDNIIGGTAAGEGNVIAFNGVNNTGYGIRVVKGATVTHNAILGNSIFSNGGLGIDLAADGVTPNDAGDVDTGALTANENQNYPALTAVTPNGGNTDISGSLNSTPNTQFRLEFFSSPSVDLTGFGEGKKFLGSIDVTTNGSGDVPNFTFSVPTANLGGSFISATATDPANNTSEFSSCKQTGSPGSLQFSSSNYSVNENGGSATITVSRAGGSSGPVSVQYSAFNGSATAPADFVATSGLLSWVDGESANKTFTVSINDDSLDEANETVSLMVSNPAGGAALGAPSSATLTINDNDPAPAISISDVSKLEGNSSTTAFGFSVTLSPSSGQSVTVNYATANGTAQAGSDYQSASGLVTFAAGETSKPITVQVNGDTQVEPNETFFVNLTNVQNATIQKSQGVGTIQNDDAPKVPGTVQFSAATFTGNEGAPQVMVTITRIGGKDGAVSVDYSTVPGGSATAGSDYQNKSGSVNWFDGDDSERVFFVPITDDPNSEPDETINLTLSNPNGGATLGNPSSAVLTIVDNDAAPTPTPTPKATPEISITDVSQAEGNGNATGFTFTVSLSVTSDQTVTMAYATADNSAVAGVDYQSVNGLLTFNPGEVSKPVVVLVNGDTQVEADETFHVNLSNVVNATIAKAQGTGAILNDDNVAPTTLQFSQSAYGVSEDLTALTITVTRTGDSSGTAAVDYVTVDGSATQKSDFEYAAGRLTFAPGETSKSFQVLTNEDMYTDGNESFSVQLSNPSGASLGQQSATQVNITDDSPESISNPIDQAQSFVHTHYHDFLNREPDAAGLQFWTNEITSCGGDQQCIETKRINVSAAYFLSIEFQQTGFLLHLLERESYGKLPKYAAFMRDLRAVGDGVVVNAPGWQQKLAANQQQLVEDWVNRPQFKTKYDALSNTDYVNALYANAGVPAQQSEKTALVTKLDTASATRASVLLDVAQNAAFRQQEQNPSFVLMQYFGYLRRDPDAAPDSDLSGYNFWLNKLTSFGGDYQKAEMVKAFLVSIEYRSRFGQQ